MRATYFTAAMVLIAPIACTQTSSESPAPVVFQGTDPNPAPVEETAPQPQQPQQETAQAPDTDDDAGPDPRGVNFHDGYETITAFEGDTVEAMASRVGLAASALASYNGLSTQYVPRSGDKLVLPPRPDGYRLPVVAEPAPSETTPTPTTAEIETAPIAEAGETAEEEDSGWSIAAITAAISGANDEEGDKPATPTEAAEEETDPASEPKPASPTEDASLSDANAEESPAEPQQSQAPSNVEQPTTADSTPQPEGDEYIPPAPASTLTTGQENNTDQAASETRGAEPAAEETLTEEPSASDADDSDTAEDTVALSDALFQKPIDAAISRPFSKSPGPDRNDGVDFAAPPGTPVIAAETGTVTLISRSIGGLGTILLLRHDNGYLSVYGRVDNVQISKGDFVRRGQVIAQVADLPAPKTPALHFELRLGADSVDPAPLF